VLKTVYKKYYDICMAEANGNENAAKTESKVNCEPYKINVDLSMNSFLGA